MLKRTKILKKWLPATIALLLACNMSFAAEKVVLWGTSVSPFVKKVQIVLTEKNISYDHVQILPKAMLKATGQAIPKEFDEASVLGKIPALQYGNFSVSDSAVISAYIEKKHSATPLYPKNAEQFAKALWFEQYSDNVLTAVVHKKLFTELFVKPNVLKHKADQKIVHHAKNVELPILFTYLDNNLQNSTYLAGDRFSIADIAVGAHFLNLRMIGIEVNEAKWPHLYHYVNRLFARASFQEFLK